MRVTRELRNRFTCDASCGNMEPALIPDIDSVLSQRLRNRVTNDPFAVLPFRYSSGSADDERMRFDLACSSCEWVDLPWLPILSGDTCWINQQSAVGDADQYGIEKADSDERVGDRPGERLFSTLERMQHQSDTECDLQISGNICS